MQFPSTIWSQDAVFFLFIFLALGVFLAFTGITQLLSRSENQSDARNRRMKMLSKGASKDEIMAVLKPDAVSGSARIPLIGALPRVLRQSGLGIGVRQFIVLCSLLVLSVALLAYQFIAVPQAVALGVLAGYVIPPMVVLHIRKKRILAMIHQLPDALDLLARRDRTMKQLAERLRIDPSSATRAVQRLVADGLAERTTAPDDGRVVVVRISEAGRERHRCIDSRRAAWMAVLLSAFDADERAQLADLLERFVVSLDRSVDLLA